MWKMTSNFSIDNVIDTMISSRDSLQSIHTSRKSEDGQQSGDEYEMHPSNGGGGGAALSPRSREYLRLRVNARERQRMHDMNSALDALRTSMPYAQGPAVKKLSKMNTLLLARNYISLLTRTLDELRRLLAETHSRQSLPWSPRLDAAMRNHELYAQQQQFTEELIRREQLQLLQIQAAEHHIKSVSPLSCVKPLSRSPACRKERRYTPILDDENINASKKRRISQRGKLSAAVQMYPDVIGSITPSIDSFKAASSPPTGTIFLPRHHQIMRGASPVVISSSQEPNRPSVTTQISTSSIHEHLSAPGFRGSMPCPCPHCFDGKTSYLLPLDFTSRTRLL